MHTVKHAIKKESCENMVPIVFNDTNFNIYIQITNNELRN